MARRAGVDRLYCALCCARGAHLSAQPAFDRRYARHELRLAGPRDPPSAEARRKGAGLAAGDHGRQAAVHSFPDCRRIGHRCRWLFRADAHILWSDSSRVRRQCPGDRARRMVAAQGQNDAVRAGWRLWRAVGHGAGRHHDFGRRHHRQRLYAAFDCGRDPRRRGVRWRRRVASRRRARRAHHGDGGLAAPHLHAHPAGLAGRGQRRDPDHRSRRSRRHHPQGVRSMTATFQTLLKRPWIWSFVGAAVVWLAAIVFTGGYGAGGMLTAALSLAAFTVIVGVGQMFVITLGPGNVDLSLPANIGLASAVAMKTIGGDDRMVLVGLAAAIACGFAVGLANYLLIWALRIPPIIATLSASFIIQSIDISYGRGLQIKPPPGFADFTNIVIAGVPVLAILTVLFTIGASIALHRTIWGRSVVAIGQNQRAARLAGLKVEPVRCLTYALCGALGGLNGALLAGYFRGANIDIGNEYLLASIAVVVIGGTSVSGGRANLPGVWGGALFLVLLLTMLNTFGVSAGVRLLLTGVIIVAVITAAGGEKAR